MIVSRNSTFVINRVREFVSINASVLGPGRNSSGRSRSRFTLEVPFFEWPAMLDHKRFIENGTLMIEDTLNPRLGNLRHPRPLGAMAPLVAFFMLLALLALVGAPALHGQSAEICDNGIDDDGDALIDCDDEDCSVAFFSNEALGNSRSNDVALGDVDGDGDLDAWVVNSSGQPNRVWINDGLGNFADNGQALGNSDSFVVALGDLDGDGDLDAWVANLNGQANRVWINDGLGNFADSGQALGNSNSTDVALGDLDGDGDLDAWVANLTQPNRGWINDGLGNFADSGQALTLVGDGADHNIDPRSKHGRRSQ